MSVCCECCVLSGRGLVTGWSLVQRSPTECGVSECDREASMRRPRPPRGCRAIGKKKRVLTQVSGIKFKKKISAGCPVVIYGQTDRMKLIGALRYFVNEPNDCISNWKTNYDDYPL
jgi:hypothetical protein